MQKHTKKRNSTDRSIRTPFWFDFFLRAAPGSHQGRDDVFGDFHQATEVPWQQQESASVHFLIVFGLVCVYFWAKVDSGGWFLVIEGSLFSFWFCLITSCQASLLAGAGGSVFWITSWWFPFVASWLVVRLNHPICGRAEIYCLAKRGVIANPNWVWALWMGCCVNKWLLRLGRSWCVQQVDLLVFSVSSICLRYLEKAKWSPEG